MWLMPSKLSFPMFSPGDSRELIEAAGLKIVKISEENPLFYEVEPAEDWITKRDGGLWTNYVDPSGTVRFRAFHKHEPWDERAFLQKA